MNTREIIELYSKTDGVQDLLGYLGGTKTVHVKGISGSGGCLITSTVFALKQRPILVCAPTKERALYLKADLESWLTGQTIHFLPDSFIKQYNPSREHALGVQERIETLSALRKNNQKVIVTYGSALSELVVRKESLVDNTFEIAKGQRLDIEFLQDFLYENGFEREDFVFEPGQFSIRGGILDLFSFAHQYPFRLELDGDIIDNIRAFDVNTQLSINEMAQFSLVPKVKKTQEIRASLFEYLSPDTLLIWEDPQVQFEELADAWQRGLKDFHEKEEEGNAIHPKDIWILPNEWVDSVSRFKRIQLGGERPSENHYTVGFTQEPQPRFNRNIEMLQQWMLSNRTANIHSLVFSDNNRQIERLQVLLKDRNIEDAFKPIYVGLSGLRVSF